MDLLLSAAHGLTAQQLREQLAVDPERGLSISEAQRRLRDCGANRLTSRRQRPLWLQFLAQFHAPLLYALLITGTVKALTGSLREAVVIWSVIVINAVIGFVQESRAERSISALAQVIRSDCEVLRDGQQQRLEAEQLVPGDVVLLAAGDRVPADLSLLQVRNLQLDESSLTGESLPVVKSIDADPADTPLAERQGMAHAGSFVSTGQGRGVVVATGDATELGHLASSLQQGSGLSTPLTRKFSRFSLTILRFVLALSILTAVVGLARGRNGAEMFDAAVALAVSAIPEELPAIVTITLAIGVHRMAQRNAIIRKLPAVEALGSATVICSDKTGTLTQNRMAVQELYAAGQQLRLEELWPDGASADGPTPDPLQDNRALRELLLAGLLCSDARPSSQEGLVGDPTETALLAAAQRAGFDHAEAHREHPRRDALPFEAELQVMATLHGSERILVKGSLEAVLPRCHWQCGSNGDRDPLDAGAIQAAVDTMASQGERVLAFAMGPVEPNQAALAHHHIESNLTFLGLQGMADPPRPEATRAVAACRAAGIAVKMITGDHIRTAAAIARQMGIGHQPEPVSIDGRALEALPADALSDVVLDTDVFARMAPAQKLQLVRSLQASGEIVAMTGDGVNDAPALRQGRWPGERDTHEPLQMRTLVLARFRPSGCRGFAEPTSRRLIRLLPFQQQHPPGLCRSPACPNRGVTLSSGRLLRYSKPPLSIPDQLQQLRDRGLLVRSDDLALNALELIGYYRLSAYWLFFEEPPAPGETRSHRFKPGSSFEQVIELYNRDRLIRLLVIDAIERIEIAARSAWVQEMSMKHGPHCYLDPLLFRSDFNHGEQLEQLRSQLQQSNETFVIHYRQIYSEPELPPIWAMTELISLGTLRAWIAATELDSKTKVARSLGMPSAQVLNGVLHSLNLLRNISPHHGRLWNRLIVKRLPKIKKLQNLLVLEDVDGEGMQPSKKLYNYLVVMAIIVRKVASLSTWPSRMAVVMSEMAPEQQGAMGCPVGWQQQQIWS